MFGFMLKKWFFDLWDNLLAVIVVNLGFVGVVSVPVLLPSAVAGAGAWAVYLAVIAGTMVVFAYLGAVAYGAHQWSSYKPVEFREFLKAVRRDLGVSLSVAAALIAHVVLLSIAVPFYLAMDNPVGLFAIAVLFWVSVAWILSLQYVQAIRAHFQQSIPVTVKKALIIMFDNLGFSFFAFVAAIVVGLISVATVFMIPGPAGITILYADALKLRLLKYDHLEEHPDDRKEIPWDALLYEERERVGKRTLRGMIFPWKD